MSENDPRYKSDRMSPGFTGEDNELDTVLICPYCREKHGENANEQGPFDKVEKICPVCDDNNFIDEICVLKKEIDTLDLLENANVPDTVIRDKQILINDLLKKLYDKRQYLNLKP